VALSRHGGTLIGQLDGCRLMAAASGPFPFSAFSIRYLKNSFRAR
jgi:hypothetical protein